MGAALRRVAFLVHLYLGLTLGFLAAILGLTGSLLVFRPELDAWVSQDLRRVPVGERTVPLSTVVQAIQARYPEQTVRTISLPRNPGDSIEVWTKQEGFQVFVDPYTGRVLGDRHEEANLFGWLFSLHTKLLIGESGEVVAGVTGGGLLMLSLSGLVVWWPRKNQRVPDLLTVKRGAGAKRFTYDLHRAMGFYACGLLAVVSVTGMGLIWDEPYRAVAQRVVGGGEAPPKPKAAKGLAPLPLDTLVAVADQAMPGGRLSRVTLPTKAGEVLNVRKQFPHETHPNGMSAVMVDPGTGKVLRADPDISASAAQRAMNVRYPLHIGRWGGLPSRVLHAALGLVPGVLLVTGLLMWRRRLARRSVRKG